MEFIGILSIFVMACFVGYYVVWSVTPALHTPLMAVTNAISSVIIVGALIAAAAAAVPVKVPTCQTLVVASAASSPQSTANRGFGTLADTIEALPEASRGCAAEDPALLPRGFPWAKWLGLLAVVLASVNIFGGFAVTARMLAMYKKKVR